MNKKCFINGISAISAQDTFESNSTVNFSANETASILLAKEPNYKEFIPPAAIRRMAKVIKMGIATTEKAMKDAQVETIDAIVVGTGMGCSQDSEKFLTNILNNKEQFLTPTSFIQSTHNTVAGQIGIKLGCKGYNMTYANSSISFESALLDTYMQITSGEAETILTGGIDENAPHYYELLKMVGHIKQTSDHLTSVTQPDSNGAVFGEGASFFILESTQKDSTYGAIIDIQMHNNLSKESIKGFITSFLENNQTSIEDIDLVVLGNNGDIDFNGYYEEVAQLMNDSTQVVYKHLIGEYFTSSAFGLWLASTVLKSQEIPESIRLNTINKEKYKSVLLYNQYRGKDHSVILIKA